MAFKERGVQPASEAGALAAGTMPAAGRGALSFNNVIFAGGGSRCLWQVGFWEGAKHAGLDLNETVTYIASASAGCAMATACALGRGRQALELFMEMTDANPANLHWRNLAPGSGKPLLPHMEMYRRALTVFLRPDDLDALENVTLEFLMARYPRWLPSTAGAMLAFGVYGLEKHLTNVLHPRWTRRMGFEPMVRGNRDVDAIGELIEIILASSTVPPVLDTGGYRGLRVLDGGIIDNVPAFLASDKPGRTLVLLSKRYRRALPEAGDTWYVQPSEPIRLDKFDYANPEGLREAFELGWRDAGSFVARARAEG